MRNLIILYQQAKDLLSTYFIPIKNTTAIILGIEKVLTV